MKLRFPEGRIRYWANRYSYGIHEGNLRKLVPIVKKQGFLNRDQLMQVALWKAPRSSGHVLKNSEEYVREISGMAFLAKQEQSRICLLTLLSGVQYPMASVILHFFHRSPYPILDFRAFWSIGIESSGNYSFEIWLAYVNFCRHIARKNAVSLRTLDKALWQFSKENQR